MKVAVADLKPNPFRNMKHYPIDAEKVKRLAQSITDTTFWDNILGRKNGDGVQIAYGHHRLRALQKVMGDKAVDIPVRPLTDEQMLKIMANENGEEWGGQTTADLETIRTVRQYLVDHPDILLRSHPVTGKHGGHLAGGKPGAAVIAAFLGGIWTEHKVKAVLDIVVPLEKGDVDEEAIRDIPTTTKAREFVAQMRGQPVRAQRAMAERVKSGKVEKAGFAAEAERHRVIPITKERKRAEVFQDVLTDAAKQARELANFLDKQLWPYKDVIRAHAWESFSGLQDLYRLHQMLEKFFGVNEKEFKALVRHIDAGR